MQERQFGATNLRVSALGLGCARIGGIFQGDADGFIDLLHAARDAGITFFDTADMYSQGESESLLGRAFGAQRDRVMIASKAGYRLPGQRRLAARLKPVLRPLIRGLGLRRSAIPSTVRGSPTQEFSSAYLRQAVEGSLRRLRTDYLDVLQLHSPPVDVVARGEWVEALDTMQREGKIRAYGVSVDTIEAGVAALKFPGVSCLQLAINLLVQEAAVTLVPRARQQRVAVIARECLANGLLAKEERDVDLASYCRSPEEQMLRAQQLSEYRRRAAAAGTTLAGLALDYVLNLDGVAVSLVGARSRQQLMSLLQQLPLSERTRGSVSLHGDRVTPEGPAPSGPRRSS